MVEKAAPLQKAKPGARLGQPTPGNAPARLQRPATFTARSAGNQAAQRQPGGLTAARPAGNLDLQAQLKRREANDPAEQAARRASERVAAGARSGPSARLPRSPVGGAAALLTPQIERRIGATRGEGKPLTGVLLAAMEHGLGARLDAARVHDGPAAAEQARNLNATAFTAGRDIFFGQGAYQPHTTSGRALLAHELAHTLQAENRTARNIRRQEASTGADPAALDNEARTRARQLWNALQGWNDAPAALAALCTENPTLRPRIQQIFRLDHDGKTVQRYLKEQLNVQDLINGFAFLRSDGQGPETALGRALLPSATADEEVNRLLYAIPRASRRNGTSELEERYNATFGREGNAGDYIGQGTLKQDIVQALSGWRQEKALALLHRELTAADDLYFDSKGIYGTHTDAVVNRIQTTWQQGPARFAELDDQWRRFVNNEDLWTTETWTTEDLEDAMRGELGGEAWDLVAAVLDGYRRARGLADREARRELSATEFATHEQAAGIGLDEDALLAREEIELAVANATLDAATTGGYTGAGTNAEQVYRAVEALRRTWQGRISRTETRVELARAQRDNAAEALAASRLRRYRQEWDSVRAALVGRSEFSEGPELRRVQLLALGSLDLADRAYLASLGHEYDEVIRLVTGYWANRQMGVFLTQAAQERRAPPPPGARPGARGPILRPVIENVSLLVLVNDSAQRERVLRVTRADYEDLQRGSARLDYELRHSASEETLRQAYNLLTTPGISAELRSDTIETYVYNHASDAPGATAVEKFLTHLGQRFETTTALHDLRDLLQPAHTVSEYRSRAEARYETAHSGWWDRLHQTGVVPALRFIPGVNTLLLFDPIPYQETYDVLSGERTEAAAAESLARLRYIDRLDRARPDELAALRQIMGATSNLELARLEYDAFRARLDDVRAVRQAIVQAMSLAVTIAVDIAATILTGGAAGPMLLASLAGTIASILVQEAALGAEYETFSEDNARQLVMVVAGAASGALARGIVGLSAGQLEKMSRAQAFFVEAAQEGLSRATSETVNAALARGAPTPESIAARAMNVVGASAGAGSRSTLARRLAEDATPMQRLRAAMIHHAVDQMIQANVDLGGQMLREGTGNLTALEIGNRLLRANAEAAARGAANGIGAYGSEARGRPRFGSDAEQAADEAAAALRGAAGAAAAGASTAGQETAAAPPARRAGLVDAAEVNAGHAMAVRRDENGRIFVTLCSPGCGNTRTLLTAGLNDPRHADIHEEIRQGLARIEEIERRYGDDPEDPAARAALDDLAQRANTIMGRTGEAALFGTEAGSAAEADPAADPAAAHAVATAPVETEAQFLARLSTIGYFSSLQGRVDARPDLVPPEVFARIQRHMPREEGAAADLIGNLNLMLSEIERAGPRHGAETGELGGVFRDLGSDDAAVRGNALFLLDAIVPRVGDRRGENRGVLMVGDILQRLSTEDVRAIRVHHRPERGAEYSDNEVFIALTEVARRIDGSAAEIRSLIDAASSQTAGEPQQPDLLRLSMILRTMPPGRHTAVEVQAAIRYQNQIAEELRTGGDQLVPNLFRRLGREAADETTQARTLTDLPRFQRGGAVSGTEVMRFFRDAQTVEGIVGALVDPATGRFHEARWRALQTAMRATDLEPLLVSGILGHYWEEARGRILPGLHPLGVFPQQAVELRGSGQRSRVDYVIIDGYDPATRTVRVILEEDKTSDINLPERRWLERDQVAFYDATRGTAQPEILIDLPDSVWANVGGREGARVVLVAYRIEHPLRQGGSQ